MTITTNTTSSTNPRIHPDTAASPTDDTHTSASATSDCEQQHAAKSSNTPTSKKARKTNHKRCHACRKKLGLAGGITCKCGFVFCSKHRYPDQHTCSFDFKAHDRAQLAKDVVGGGEFAKVERV